jgi:hypothetical protein
MDSTALVGKEVTIQFRLGRFERKGRHFLRHIEMKTPEQWFEEYLQRTAAGDESIQHGGFIRAIQRDAYTQGIKDAAQIASRHRSHDKTGCFQSVSSAIMESIGSSF